MIRPTIGGNIVTTAENYLQFFAFVLSRGHFPAMSRAALRRSRASFWPWFDWAYLAVLRCRGFEASDHVCGLFSRSVDAIMLFRWMPLPTTAFCGPLLSSVLCVGYVGVPGRRVSMRNCFFSVLRVEMGLRFTFWRPSCLCVISVVRGRCGVHTRGHRARHSASCHLPALSS